MELPQGAASGPSNGLSFDHRQLRLLKAAILVMSIILVVGFAVVLGRIAYLVTREDTHPQTSLGTSQARLALPGGALVRALSLSGNRLAVHYEAPAGAGIAILDLATGETVAHVELAPR